MAVKKIYYLGTCSTCQRILKQLDLPPDVVLQEIKTQPVTAPQLEQMKQRAGSYQALFSRRAMKYRAWGLHKRSLTEKDYRELILKEYTFLKRPVIIAGDQIFIGSSARIIAEVRKAFHSPGK
jgi:arsenate reductase